MGERYAVLVDSTCDLPPDFIERHNIEILPITVRFGSFRFIDVRNPETTLAVYREGIDERGVDAESIPFSSEQIARVIEERVAPAYDGAQIITINGGHSLMYENARKAAIVYSGRFKQVRKDLGHPPHFGLRVLDSRTLFTGEAVLAYEAVRLLKEEQQNMNRLSGRLQALREQVTAYLIPVDLYYVHKRGKTKGDGSIGWLSYKLGSLLNVRPVIQAHKGETRVILKSTGFDSSLDKLLQIVAQKIKHGLEVPVVAMSYAGDLDRIRYHPMVQRFEEYARSQGVEVLLSVMSIAAGINVGAGAFSLAVAAAD